MSFPNAFQKNGMGRFLPPGAGASWTPASLGANLKGWWKADAGVRARTAAQFTGANSESLSIADASQNPSLDMGDVDFWFAGKVYMDSVAAGFDTFFGKGNINGPYALYRNAAALKFVVGDGVTPVQPQVTGLSAATWYHFMGYYDSVNDLVGISIDGAAFVTLAQVGGTNVNASDFSVGADLSGVGFLDGRVQELACGKSPPGGIAAIVNEIRDAFYNGGAGLAVAAVTTAQRTAWGGLSAWPMHENSGTRADIWGSNTLTDNNTVTANDGKVDYAAADGDAVWKWEDQSGAGVHLTQTTHAAKPTLQTNEINGLPVLRGDGSDDVLINSGNDYDSIGTFSAFGIFKHDSTLTGAQVLYGKGDSGASQEFFVSHDTTANKLDMGQGGGTRILTATNADAEDTEHYFYNERGGDTGAWTAAIRTDGAANGTAAAIATNPAGDNAFGVFGLGTGAGIRFKGDIAELALVDDVLAAGSITLAETYLATRSGV